MKWLMKYAWCIFLGMAPTLFFGYDITKWQWWVFVIPVVLLVGISKLVKD